MNGSCSSGAYTERRSNYDTYVMAGSLKQLGVDTRVRTAIDSNRGGKRLFVVIRHLEKRSYCYLYVDDGSPSTSHLDTTAALVQLR